MRGRCPRAAFGRNPKTAVLFPTADSKLAQHLSRPSISPARRDQIENRLFQNHALLLGGLHHGRRRVQQHSDLAPQGESGAFVPVTPGVVTRGTFPNAAYGPRHPTRGRDAPSQETGRSYERRQGAGSLRLLPSGNSSSERLLPVILW